MFSNCHRHGWKEYILTILKKLYPIFFTRVELFANKILQHWKYSDTHVMMYEFYRQLELFYRVGNILHYHTGWHMDFVVGTFPLSSQCSPFWCGLYWPILSPFCNILLFLFPILVWYWCCYCCWLSGHIQNLCKWPTPLNLHLIIWRYCWVFLSLPSILPLISIDPPEVNWCVQL